MKVLYVDDKKTWHTLFEKVLSGRGIEVFHAYTLKETLNQINTEKPDVVIVDATIRNAKIYDILPQILELGVPVIAVGYPQEGFNPDRVVSMGAVAAFEKPFEAQVLIEKLRELRKELPSLKREIKPELMITQPPGLEEEKEVPVEEVTYEPEEISVLPVEETEELEVHPVGGEEELRIEEPLEVETGELQVQEIPKAEEIVRESVKHVEEGVKSAAPKEVISEEEIEKIVREIAWEIVPEIAEKVIREEIQEFIKSRLA